MSVLPKLTIKIDSTKALRAIRAKPKQIARANRLIVNKIVRIVHKEVGGTISRASGTNAPGFRRERTKKSNAKASQRRQVGRVWIGANDVRSHWLKGKARNVNGGARVGKHFFADAFVATMASGYTGVFKRSQTRAGSGKASLIEQSAPTSSVQSLSEQALNTTAKKVDSFIHETVKKAIDK